MSTQAIADAILELAKVVREHNETDRNGWGVGSRGDAPSYEASRPALDRDVHAAPERVHVRRLHLAPELRGPRLHELGQEHVV